MFPIKSEKNLKQTFTPRLPKIRPPQKKPTTTTHSHSAFDETVLGGSLARLYTGGKPFFHVTSYGLIKNKGRKDLRVHTHQLILQYQQNIL